MAGKVRTWVWVVVGFLVFCVLAVVAMAGAGIYFFSQHVQTETVSEAKAARDFEEIKARFGDTRPLIELDSRGRFVRSNGANRAAADPGTRPPEQLHVLAFDPDHGQVVRLAIPFWLLRLKTRGTRIDLNGRKMDLEDLKLTVEDLERYGPALIVDHRTDDGERVLVWSQ
jgi:hypothetical protein